MKALVRFRRAILAVAATWAMVGFSSRASAQTPIEGRAASLGAALETLAQQNKPSASQAALSLALGALYVGAGTFVAFDKHEPPGDSEWRGIAVSGTVLVGSIFFASGIHELMPGRSTSEVRNAQFQRDVALGRANEYVVARYEGELHADAVRAYVMRREMGWLFAGGAVGGAGLIAIAATSDLRGDARALTYLEGGVLGAYCLYGSIASFNTETAVERVWRAYRYGPLVSDQIAHWSLAPLVSPSSAGLAAIGTF